jgi:heat shock protein HslJ
VRTPRIWLSIACATVLGISACGDDDDSASSTPSVATSEPVQPGTTTPPAGSAATTAPAQSTATTATGQSVEGPTWTLTSGLEAPMEGVTVTAKFADGNVSGSSGCNTYTGNYQLDGTSLTIGPDIGSTLKACPDAETAVEQEYLGALPNVASYTIENGVLALTNADGSTTLEFEVTDAAAGILGDWTVTGYYTGDAISSPVGGVTLTATFAEDSMSGDSGCNTFNGPYTLDGDAITIGPLASTLTACPSDELNQQEAEYLTALGTATSYTLTGDRLDLLRPGDTIAVSLVRD